MGEEAKRKWFELGWARGNLDLVNVRIAVRYLSGLARCVQNDVGGWHWVFLEAGGSCVERTQFLRSSSVEACSHAGSNGRIAVWWSLRWATMLCCSFHVHHPAACGWRRMWADLHHVASLPCVKGRGICDIEIDRHGGFEMTMGGTHVPVLVRQYELSAPAGNSRAIHRVASAILVERQAGDGRARSAGDLRAIAVSFAIQSSPFLPLISG